MCSGITVVSKKTVWWLSGSHPFSSWKTWSNHSVLWRWVPQVCCPRCGAVSRSLVLLGFVLGKEGCLFGGGGEGFIWSVTLPPARCWDLSRRSEWPVWPPRSSRLRSITDPDLINRECRLALCSRTFLHCISYQWFVLHRTLHCSRRPITFN